jgi:hypothetical protein
VTPHYANTWQPANKADKVVLGGGESERVGVFVEVTIMWPRTAVTHCKEIDCITSHTSRDVFLFLSDLPLSYLLLHYVFKYRKWMILTGGCGHWSATGIANLSEERDPFFNKMRGLPHAKSCIFGLRLFTEH